MKSPSSHPTRFRLAFPRRFRQPFRQDTKPWLPVLHGAGSCSVHIYLSCEVSALFHFFLTSIFQSSAKKRHRGLMQIFFGGSCKGNCSGRETFNFIQGTWTHFSIPADNSPLKSVSHSPVFSGCNHISNNHLPELTTMLSPMVSNSVKIAPIGKEHNKLNHIEPLTSNSIHGVPFHHSHSFPDRAGELIPNLSFSPCTMASSGSPAS